MSDALQTDLGRRGLKRQIDRGSTADRQPNEWAWHSAASHELNSTPTGDHLVFWDLKCGSPTIEVAEFFGPSLGVKKVEDDGELFTRFLKLGHRERGAAVRFGEENPEAVLDFASRYGLFLICQAHGQPATGCPHWDRDGEPCEAGYPRVTQVVELSSQVRHVLHIAVRIASGEEVASSDWERLVEIMYDLESLGPDSPLRASILGSWQGKDPDALVPTFVNRWLEFGQVGLALSHDRPYKVEMASKSVLGALARHLLLLVTGEPGFAVCSGCGEFYTPKQRRPKKNQNRWCEECGPGTNYRPAKRASYRSRS